MTNALPFIYKALEVKMTDYDFKCKFCGDKIDGTMPFHDKPEKCSQCSCVDFEELLDEPIDDKKENEHDFDYLAGKG